MIVNAHHTMHVIVELDPEDIKQILKGKGLYMRSCAHNDEDVLVHVYGTQLPELRIDLREEFKRQDGFNE